MIAGSLKRFLSRTSRLKRHTVLRFHKHVRCRLREEFIPLPHDHDFDLDTWLAESNYPLWRQDEIRCAWEENLEVLRDPKQWRVKSFMKDEGYMDLKHARGINSREDSFKALVGPLFHAIEKEVFKHEVFVKYIPVRERAAYIWDALWVPGGEYITTDYTSFEASFELPMMVSCEFEMYLYMLHRTPVYMTMLLSCWVVIGGINVCTFKYFVVWVFATRMSGEMCTSLGNGFANWMICDFVCHESNVKYVGRFEGDDGIARLWGGQLKVELFAELGLKIKLIREADLAEASFCGLIFDPEDKAIVTDPLKVLASFGWGKSSYRGSSDSVLRQLLRAKALSFMYQYPACPIVTELARYALRVTRNETVRRSIVDRFGWKKDLLEKALDLGGSLDDQREIGINTRLLMERKFGITIETQLQIEGMLRSKQDLEPISMPLLEYPPCLELYNEDYVFPWPVGDESFIGEWWANYAGFSREW